MAPYDPKRPRPVVGDETQPAQVDALIDLAETQRHDHEMDADPSAPDADQAPGPVNQAERLEVEPPVSPTPPMPTMPTTSARSGLRRSLPVVALLLVAAAVVAIVVSRRRR